VSFRRAVTCSGGSHKRAHLARGHHSTAGVEDLLDLQSVRVSDRDGQAMPREVRGISDRATQHRATVFRSVSGAPIQPNSSLCAHWSRGAPSVGAVAAPLEVQQQNVNILKTCEGAKNQAHFCKVSKLCQITGSAYSHATHPYHDDMKSYI
jgi:hypothetical protein